MFHRMSYVALIACAAITVQVHGATVQDFDNIGTAFTATQHNTAPGPVVLGGGPSGNFMRIANDGVGNQANTVVFDLSDPVVPRGYSGSFDFRMGGGGNGADGIGFAILDTATFGNSGAVGFFNEEPNLANSIAIGLDTHDNGGGDLSEDSVSLHFNGSKIAEVDLTGTLDLENNLFNRLFFDIRNDGPDMIANVSIVEDVFGAANNINVFSNVTITGAQAYEARIGFSARTGGLNDNHDIDNINISFIPEPTTATLALLGLAGLASRRRRA